MNGKVTMQLCICRAIGYKTFKFRPYISLLSLFPNRKKKCSYYFLSNLSAYQSLLNQRQVQRCIQKFCVSFFFSFFLSCHFFSSSFSFRCSVFNVQCTLLHSGQGYLYIYMCVCSPGIYCVWLCVYLVFVLWGEKKTVLYYLDFKRPVAMVWSCPFWTRTRTKQPTTKPNWMENTHKAAIYKSGWVWTTKQNGITAL